MKTHSILFIILLFALASACKKEEEPVDTTPAALGTATNQIKMALDSLDKALVQACNDLSVAGTDTTAVRQRLKQIYAASSFAKEADYINVSRIMQICEPPEFYKYQGTNFSSDSVVNSVIETGIPFFTDYFIAKEGFSAVADLHYLNSPGCPGILEVLFNPSELLQRIITPLVISPDEIWVLEKNGVVLFEPDLTGNGKSVFEDEYYTQFPSFVNACKIILDYESGTTTYTFYLTGSSTPVSKTAWWYTIHLHNNAWKVIFSSLQ